MASRRERVDTIQTLSRDERGRQPTPEDWLAEQDRLAGRTGEGPGEDGVGGVPERDGPNPHPTS
jgi:hypothetical protein